METVGLLLLIEDQGEQEVFQRAARITAPVALPNEPTREAFFGGRRRQKLSAGAARRADAGLVFLPVNCGVTISVTASNRPGRIKYTGGSQGLAAGDVLSQRQLPPRT